MRIQVRPLLLAALVLSAEPATAPAAAPIPPTMVLRAIDRNSLPGWVKVASTFDRAVGWADARGQNILLFTTRESVRKRGTETLRSYELTVEQMVKSTGQVLTMHTVRDLIGMCKWDLVGRVMPDSIAVTDLDGDGVGEVTFAYEIGCHREMSPNKVILLVLQGERKYILRGESLVDDPVMQLPGVKYRAEPVEAQWPHALLEHAKKMWLQVLKKSV